ncbi:MAG: hypothetical protein H7239_13600 [Flavobacterium sp.]|nr:hypothetical protein [Flavobacterium sp.]
MIIATNSFFRTPPANLHPEQIVAFNAIRYSVDICELIFERLEKNLFDFAFNPSNENYTGLIFSDVWSIINNATILKNVIKRQFNIPDTDPLLIKLKEIEGLRHSNQHLDERINQITSLDNLLPIYGTISWLTKQDGNSEEGILSVICSGTVYRDLNTKPENPAGKINNKKINDIKFTGINRIDKTNFNETSVYINEIIDCIKEIIKNFENQIDEQFQIIDTFERHIPDLIIQFKVREVVNWKTSAI